ncbi:DegV family protein [Gemella sp.]
MEWKIVVDTACDFREIPNKAENVIYERVPFSLQIEDKVFVDTLDLDIDKMMEEMYASSEPARSACPSPEAYLAAYRGAKNVIVLTLTGAMSGSYNSAVIGEKMLKEENKDVNIYIIDTLSAGGENDLYLLKINELIKEGLSFDEVVSEMKKYQENSKLIFVLEKVDNLVKNGRLNKLAATVVGLLNMRMVGEASNEGTLHLLHKVRGEKKAVSSVVDEMIKAGYKGGRVVVTHRNNEDICKKIQNKLREKFLNIEFMIVPTSGICSFYGEEGGMLLGYEI